IGIRIEIGAAAAESQRSAPPSKDPEPKRVAKHRAERDPEPKKKEEDPCEPKPNGSLEEVAPRASPGKVQMTCGMISEHAKNLAKFAQASGWIVIVRETDQAMQKFFDQDDVHPKPPEMKDIKIGPRGKVLWNGKWYHSDYDLMGVFDAGNPGNI